MIQNSRYIIIHNNIIFVKIPVFIQLNKYQKLLLFSFDIVSY
jgi:hypothetical protein